MLSDKRPNLNYKEFNRAFSIRVFVDASLMIE